MPPGLYYWLTIVLQKELIQQDLKIESYVKIFEICANKIEIISEPSVTLPFDTTKKELNLNSDLRFDFRPLILRHPKQRAIFKIQSAIYNEFSNFLTRVF